MNWARRGAFAALMFGVGPHDAEGQEAYLAKVGPSSVRLLIPRAALPSIVLFADPTKAKPVAVQVPAITPASAVVPAAGSDTALSAEAFVGPPAPPEQSLASAPPPSPSVESVVSARTSSPQMPSEVRLAGAAPPEPFTAQMMVRFFRPSSSADTLTGAFVPGSGPAATPATETAVWLPIQFQLPEPLGIKTRSSATYEEVSATAAPLEKAVRASPPSPSANAHP